MSEERSFVRLAGRGRGSDGAIVTWTIAEGRRGRRWRESVVRDGELVHALLYETDPDRRFSHLELAVSGGLATLHPEGDGTLHGNVVRPGSGMEHVAGMPLAPGGSVLVGGSIVASAAVAWAEQGSGGDRLPMVVLDPVTLRLSTETVLRATLAVTDGRGVPVMDDSRIWSLEDAEEG
jgi:hypothetical protein